MLEASDAGALRHVPIRDGDLVCPTGDPAELYSVILVRDGRCWLRNLQTEMDTVSSLGGLRRIGHESGDLGGLHS
ncbi:MAG TPA: hypothetical protein VIJ94_14180 [Caulobacteraceae bacterium]